MTHRGRPDTAFGPVQQIDAGVLDVGYVDAGPADGPAVLLLHGWPYDIHSYAEVAPIAGGAGLPRDRAVPARLRHDALPLRRDGPQRPAGGACRRRGRADGRARIDPAIVAGFDWGARTPTSSPRCGPSAAAALVSVSGYLIGSQAASEQPLPPAAELQWWYQYYFATERGRAGYDAQPPRVRQADLAHRVAEVGLRRRDVRPQRGLVRQP